MTQTLVSNRRRAARRINPALIQNRQIALLAPSSSSHLPVAAEALGLSGNYEVVLPGSSIAGRIFFVETLAEAARLLARNLMGRTDDPAPYLMLLEENARRGGMVVGGRGMFFQQGSGDKVAFATVKPRQKRPAPRFQVGDAVYTDALEGELTGSKVGYIRSVYVTNHPSVGRQYVYGIGSYSFRENRLATAPPTRKR